MYVYIYAGDDDETPLVKLLLLVWIALIIWSLITTYRMNNDE